MKYNLRIGKTRYTGKTLAECVDIIAARYNEVNANCIIPAAWIITEIITITENVRRLTYHGHDEKVFVSVNRREA